MPCRTCTALAVATLWPGAEEELPAAAGPATTNAKRTAEKTVRRTRPGAMPGGPMILLSNLFILTRLKMPEITVPRNQLYVRFPIGAVRGAGRRSPPWRGAGRVAKNIQKEAFLS